MSAEFYVKMAAVGLTPSQVGAALLRTKGKQAGVLTDLRDLGGVATALAIGAPLAAGVAGGYGAAHLTRPDYDSELVAMRQRELTRQMRLAVMKMRGRKNEPATQGPDNPGLQPTH